MVLWLGVGLWIGLRLRVRLIGFGLGLVGLMGLGWPFAPAGEGLLIVSANVQAFASGRAELETRLGQEGADVVLTIEKRAEQIPGLERVADNFEANLPKPSHGMAFFCRRGLRCSAWISPAIGAKGCRMPVGLLRLEEKICVMGVHVPPPVPICATGVRPYVQWMTDRIEEGRMALNVGPCKKGDPVLAIGDFNSTQGSWTTRKMLAEGLRDPQYHRGIYASTWPAGGGWPNFPVFRLDHVFPGELDITGIQQFRLPQADHKALRVWLSLD
jgi:endonuclease/exonuclease/phosphatase (EEP) superfamily protein YafD